MRCGLISGVLGFGMVILCGFYYPAHAGELQAAPLRNYPRPLPASPSNDPLGVGCRDFRNRPVRMVEIPALGDVGRAEFIDGFPVIMLDPAVMQSLPSNLQTFFKLHECGHHVLGHLFAPTFDSEKEADCWAVHEGHKRQTFTHDDIVAWKPYFAASRGSTMGHLPGPERVAFLLTCYDEP